MKYIKPLIVAGAVSIATIGGVSAIQLFPIQDDNVAVKNAMETSSEEVMPKQEETASIGETINPAPLPASEPVVTPTPPPSTPVLSREEMLKKVFLLVNDKTAGDPTMARRTTPLTVAIMSKFEAKQQLFTDQSLQNTVDRCYDYIKTLAPEAVTGSLAMNECGL